MHFSKYKDKNPLILANPHEKKQLAKICTD
jgi:hypothetical protein